MGNDSWFNSTFINWFTRKNRVARKTTERNVKGGALWGASPCLLSARACPTATHTVVQRRVCVRERVWAPVMVVIVVNLTTVKAVTACPYEPVYATECGAPGAVQNLLLSSKSRSSLRFRVGRYLVGGYTINTYTISRREKIRRREREGSAWRNWFGRLIERRELIARSYSPEYAVEVHSRDEA